jgi:hypothetical protein
MHGGTSAGLMSMRWRIYTRAMWACPEYIVQHLYHYAERQYHTWCSRAVKFCSVFSNSDRQSSAPAPGPAIMTIEQL